MNADLTNINGKITTNVEAKAIASPDPSKVAADKLAEILSLFVTYLDANPVIAATFANLGGNPNDNTLLVDKFNDLINTIAVGDVSTTVGNIELNDSLGLALKKTRSRLNVSGPNILKGRKSAGAGPMEDLTADDVKTILGLPYTTSSANGQILFNLLGVITGNSAFSFDPATKKITVGATGNPASMEVINSSSSLTAYDGQKITIGLADNLTESFVIQNKVTGKKYALVKTNAAEQGLVAVESFDLDALIGAKVKHRMAEAATAATTKVYFNLPGTTTPADMDLLNNGNFLGYEANVYGISADGLTKGSVKINCFATKGGGAITIVNNNVTPLPATITAIGLETNPSDATNYVRLAITPATTTAMNWFAQVVYTKY